MRRMGRTLVIAGTLLLPTAALGQSASEERREAARDLLAATQMERMMAESTESMLRMQIEANPQLAQFEGVLREFLSRHLTWENLEPEFVELYTRHFTADELGELADFYRTDLGQKAVSLQGVLLGEGANIGQRVVQENMGELQQMIMQRAQELQSEGDGDPRQ